MRFFAILTSCSTEGCLLVSPRPYLFVRWIYDNRPLDFGVADGDARGFPFRNNSTGKYIDVDIRQTSSQALDESTKIVAQSLEKAVHFYKKKYIPSTYFTLYNWSISSAYK